jgi:phosphoribosylamine--glycine ligase
LENVNSPNSILFHAGTAIKDEQTVTNGGRVLCVTSYGSDVVEAVRRSILELEKISYTGISYRSDIGYEFE